MTRDSGGSGVPGQDVSDKKIDEFLERLEADLVRHPWMSQWRTQQVVEEVRAHLADSVESLEDAGRSPPAAAEEALGRFGCLGATRLALTQINDRWRLMLLKVAAGAAAGITSLMAGAILVFALVVAPAELRSSNALLATLVLAANFTVLWHLYFRPLQRNHVVWLGIGVLLMGLFITAVSTRQAIRGPDPEYWIILMGIMLVGEAGCLLLGRWSSRFRTA